MKFVDNALITIASGNGGRGAVSFRREKFIPKGGPDGGDGGGGGDVLFNASHNITSLLDFRYKPRYIAGNGGNGQGNNKKGRDGKDIVITVPVGTTVVDFDSNEIIADLAADGEKAVLLRGGIGGKGNSFFKTSTNRRPRFAQPGTSGKTKKVRLILKSIGDIGIVGLPNAGKSTLISKLTGSRPKIASYPFTTKTPNLGVFFDDGTDKTLTLVDIPGIIEGASEGAGMGLKFLSHIERSNILLHLIEIGTLKEIEDRYKIVVKEIAGYKEEILKKKQIAVINKIDLITDTKKLNKIMKEAEKFFEKENIPVYFISAYNNAGINELKNILNASLNKKEIAI
ncbi:MAG: GTPase ObgE [Deltaproteobacteria bacterium]|nr:GTPase ObgE [Deltaproteobacteria bacterium]